MDRPVTSKSRGQCRYYQTDRGCFARDRCKFLHGETEKITPYDRSKICVYFVNGFCRRGDACWFLHESPQSLASSSNVSELEHCDSDDACSICFEKPSTYGLLSGCNHVFCIDCIRHWRDPKDKTEEVISAGSNKKCPMCRSASRFITPSSRTYSKDHPGKVDAIRQYRASMERVPCRYFQSSNPSKRFCPFGRDCFYQHRNDDGTPYHFSEGVEHCMRIYRSRQRREALASSRSTTNTIPFPSRFDALNQIYGNPLEDLSATIEAIRASMPAFMQNLPTDMTNEALAGEGAESGNQQTGGGTAADSAEIENLERLAERMLATLTAMHAGMAEDMGQQETHANGDEVQLRVALRTTGQDRETPEQRIDWSNVFVHEDEDDHSPPSLLSVSDTSDDESSPSDNESAGFGTQNHSNVNLTRLAVTHPFHSTSYPITTSTVAVTSPGNRPTGAIRPYDLVFGSISPSTGPFSSVTPDLPVTTNPRFSTVVNNRESERFIIHLDSEDESEDEAEDSVEVLGKAKEADASSLDEDLVTHLAEEPTVASSTTTATSATSEDSSIVEPVVTGSSRNQDIDMIEVDPPFVTDGRGRVVWSSTRSRLGHNEPTTSRSTQAAPRRPTPKSRRSDRVLMDPPISAAPDCALTLDSLGSVDSLGSGLIGDEVVFSSEVDRDSHGSAAPVNAGRRN